MLLNEHPHLREAREFNPQLRLVCLDLCVLLDYFAILLLCFSQIFRLLGCLLGEELRLLLYVRLDGHDLHRELVHLFSIQVVEVWVVRLRRQEHRDLLVDPREEVLNIGLGHLVTVYQ